jgi:hypothetical protein
MSAALKEAIKETLPPQPTPEEAAAHKVIWEPIRGTSQDLALDSRCHSTLYHGTRGVGKTAVQLMRFRRRVGLGYGKFWRGVIFDREFKNLADIVQQSKRFFEAFGDGAKWISSASEYKWVWPTGEELLFRHAKKLEDYDAFHGHEYPFIGFNELTKHGTGDLYYKLLSTNRSSFLPEEHTPHEVVSAHTLGAIEGIDRVWRRYFTSNGKPLPKIPLEVFNTTNPSGRGRSWVKRDMVDVGEPGEVVTTRTEVYNPQTQKEEWVEMTHVHIFGSWRENRFIDPKYVAWLKSIKDPNLRRAWLLGDWSVTTGGAIDDLWNDNVHILPANFVPPKEWHIDRAFDWGSSTPACVIWFAQANGEEAKLPDGSIFAPPAGSLIAFREWYICAKDDVTGKPMIGTNKGAKMSPTMIAKGIKKREIGWLERKLILRQPSAGPADNQIRNVLDVSNETIEVKMSAEGVKWTESDKSKGSNAMGLQVIRDRLEAALLKEGKALYVTRDCPATIELVPPIPRSEEKPDEAENEYENHAYDVIKYRCLAGNKNAQGKIRVKAF